MFVKFAINETFVCNEMFAEIHRIGFVCVCVVYYRLPFSTDFENGKTISYGTLIPTENDVYCKATLLVRHNLESQKIKYY